MGQSPAKRAKAQPTMILCRGIKLEMKHGVSTVVHAATASTNQSVNLVGQGSGISEKIGSKIKILFIEGIVQNVSDTSLKIDMPVGNDAGDPPPHGCSDPVERQAFSVLKTFFLCHNAPMNADGHLVSHELPLGLVFKHSNATGASVPTDLLWHTDMQTANNKRGGALAAARRRMARRPPRS